MSQPVGVCRQSGMTGCECSCCECVHHFAKTLCQTPIITLTPQDCSAIFAECFQESEMCTYLVDARWNNNHVSDPKYFAVFIKPVWNLKHPCHRLSVQGRTPVSFATYKHFAISTERCVESKVWTYLIDARNGTKHHVTSKHFFY